VGLGHLRRNTAIASRLVEQLPGSNALLLTSVPPGHFFDCPAGVDIVKLPSVARKARGFAPRTPSLSPERLRRMRTGIIDSLTHTFRPDLVLVDHLPSGASGELSSTLRELKRRPHPPSVVLGLRDIVDDPATLTPRWERSGIYRQIDELYDAVLIYGSRQVFDTAGEYGLHRQLSVPVHHCGYVLAEPQLRGVPLGDRDPEFEGKPLVVVTAGGGADGFPMMRLVVDALRLLPPPIDLEAVFITGPFMSRAERRALRARGAGLPIHVRWSVEQAPRYFEAADVIITMAGYNTLLEAISLRKKTLVMPRLGPSAEQTLRAGIFSRRGLVRSAGIEGRTPSAVARLIETCLAGEAPTETLPQMDGLDEVVSRLRTLLTERASRHHFAIR